MYLLNSLLDGVSIEEIIEGIPVKRIRKKADQMKESIRCSPDITQVILIRGGLDQIESIQKRIDELDREIKIRVVNRKEDLKIATSIPGIELIYHLFAAEWSLFRYILNDGE